MSEGVTQIETPQDSPDAVAGGDSSEQLGTDLSNWARALPEWQQDLVVRLLTTASLSDEESDDAKSRILKATGFDDGRQVEETLTANETMFSAYQAGTSGEIKSLGQLKSVNGISGDARPPLEFSTKGMTVVYGANAAGKTSYARTLKYVGRAVGPPTRILPDVRATEEQPTPSAEIVLAIDGLDQPELIEFDKPPPEACSMIRAFDSGSADTYVEDKTVADFTPPVLGVFKRLADTQTALANSFRERAERLRAFSPDLELTEGTAAHAAVAGFKKLTDLAEFKGEFTITDGDRERKEQLDSDVLETGPKLNERIRATKSSAANARETLKVLEEIDAVVADKAIENRARLRAAAEEKGKAAKALNDETFGEDAVSADAISAWRILWDAARDYFHVVEGHDAEFPPESEGDTCPLCAQDLEKPARERFKRFKAFVSRTVAQDAKSAQDQVDAAEAKLSDDLPTPNSDLVAEIRELNDAIADKIDEYVRAATTRREELISEDTKEGKTELPELPKKALEDLATARDDRATELEDLKDEEKKAKLETELAELSDKITVGEAIGDFGTWHQKLPEFTACEAAEQLLGTGDVTRAHGKFSKQVITQTFLEQLRSELKGLGLGYFKVDVKEGGASGDRMIELKMTDFAIPKIRLSDVLSEGERRGLGLACFLAEIVTFGGSGPIVLDDPVSSFDHERRAKVAGRLHSESEGRQVIVFTHDVSFMARLIRFGKDRKNEVALRHISRKGNEPGFLENEPPVQLAKVKDRVKILRKELEELPDPKDVAAGVFTRLSKNWYSDLRELWERVVESVVLNEAIERFGRDIHTQQLKHLVIDPADEVVVAENMTKASNFSHAAPEGDAPPTPGIAEMTDDLDVLDELVKAINKRRDESRKQAKV